MENENKNTENQDANLSVVQKAEKLRDEIKAENDRREKILAQEEKIRADQLLSGTAGGRVEPAPKVETAKEYADKVMRGEIKAA